MNTRLSASAAVLSFTALLGAQTNYWVSPPNAATRAGGTANTIPWWGRFATYQQVHDAGAMGLPVMPIKGIAFRVGGSRTNTGRDAEMWLQMSTVQTTAATASTTFATNLAGANTQSVFGTQSTWTKFSWATATGTGPVNPPAYTIPFTQTYNYIGLTGNLCWEWRFKNATSNTNSFFDATNGSSHRGTLLASTGVGCTASGQLAAATCTISNPTVNNEQLVRIALANGNALAPSFLAVGVSNATNAIGWCAPIITPALVVPMGLTSSTGGLQFDVSMSSLGGAQPASVYAQFAFGDPGLGGIGVSNVDGFTTPNIPGANGITRVWNVPAGGSTAGPELATTGSVGHRYGIVILWQQ